MKTFKFSLVALIATALFTACSNDEAVLPVNDEAQAISFRLQGGTPEIATRTTATTLPYVDAFVVYGTDDVYGATNDLIFDGVTVARDINKPGYAFAYAPTRYYDINAATAAFIAYSPASAKVVNVVTTDFWTPNPGEASFDYTVPAPDKTGNTVQEDLLVAIREKDAVASTVSLEFEHALARIFVTASNSTKDPVFIDSLILRNLKTTGTLEFDMSAGTKDWNPATATADYAYILAPSGVAVDSSAVRVYVTTMEQGMMVLPQATVNTAVVTEFDNGDFALQVNYRFSNLGIQKKFIMLPNNYPFEAGKQYLINIEFAGTGIDFEIKVDPFGPLTPVN